MWFTNELTFIYTYLLKHQKYYSGYTLQCIYIFKYKYISFCFLDKILLKVSISCSNVYCVIFGFVIVRVVDYLEFVDELLLLNVRCSSVLIISWREVI